VGCAAEDLDTLGGDQHLLLQLQALVLALDPGHHPRMAPAPSCAYPPPPVPRRARY
jgi:hypothetical protein